MVGSYYSCGIQYLLKVIDLVVMKGEAKYKVGTSGSLPKPDYLLDYFAGLFRKRIDSFFTAKKMQKCSLF